MYLSLAMKRSRQLPCQSRRSLCCHLVAEADIALMLDHFGPVTARARREVVITGLGIVCSLGSGVEAVWQRLLGSSCGIRDLTLEDFSEGQQPGFDRLPLTEAGLVPESSLSNAREELPHLQKDRRTAPFVTLAEIAAAEALQDARWTPTDRTDRARSGVAIGCGLSFTEEIAEAGVLQSSTNLRRLSPHFVPRVLGNMAAGQVSMWHGLQGPNLAPACAGSAGAHAICDAFRLVRDGTADVMLAGGTDACIDVVALTAYGKATGAHEPDEMRVSVGSPSAQSACPLGQGAAILVLEELQHARARQAHIHAEVRGSSTCGAPVAVHPLAWQEQPEQAIAAALLDAGLSHSHIGLWATGTPPGGHAAMNDWWSKQGLRGVSGSGSDAAPQAAAAGKTCESHDSVAVLSTTAALGLIPGAAGAMEALFTTLALNRRVVPNATRNNGQFDMYQQQLDTECTAALVSCCGFGGHNAAFVLTTSQADSDSARPSQA